MVRPGGKGRQIVSNVVYSAQKSVGEERDGLRVLCEVEDLGRSEQPKTLPPLAESWTPRVVLGSKEVNAARRWLCKVSESVDAQGGKRGACGCWWAERRTAG